MISDARTGRPRASSRETLAEAACDLFLEQGYEATSVADIAQRAGVSRSSFFNYFSSKSDVLWSGLDARIDLALRAIAERKLDATGESVRAHLVDIVTDFAPDTLALALRNRAVMGLGEEFVRDTALRHARLMTGIAAAARRSGNGAVRADILGAAYAAALLSSLRGWAEQGAGTSSPETQLQSAFASISALTWAE